MSASEEFRKHFTLRKLKNTFDTYIKTNTAIGVDQMSYDVFKRDHKCIHIPVIKRKILNGTYNFSPYKEKLIVKSRNQYPRLISIPTIRDKLVLKSLHLTIDNTFDNISQPLPRTCINDLKNAIGNYDYFIQLDIKNFYDSINHDILFNKLQKKIKKEEILDLLKKSLETPTSDSKGVYKNHNTDNVIDSFPKKGVPQGLSTSNILAQIYMKELDQKYNNKANITYVRYIDDIIILCNKNDSSQILKELIYDIEKELDLDINLNKTNEGSTSEGFEFLGYKLFNYNNNLTVTVKDSNIKKFEQSLVGIFTSYRYSKNKNESRFIFTLNNKITGAVSKYLGGNLEKPDYYGWLFYFSQINNTGVLYRLDAFISKLMKKYPETRKIDQNRIKKFIKAFYEIKYHPVTTSYIHRPDERDLDEKIRLLHNTFDIPSHELDSLKKVESLYRKLVYRPIYELEKDIKRDIS